MGGRWIALAVGALVIVLAMLLQIAMPNGFPLVKRDSGAAAAVNRISEIHSNGPLRINEIMSGNRGTLVLAGGASPDWIEIMNVGRAAVELEGWSLAENESGGNVFSFPRMQLQAGECVLVVADGILRTDAAEMLHAPFRLSSSGDTLMLFNSGGSAVDSVNIPALGRDQSYMRSDAAAWAVCTSPTPGQPNTAENFAMLSAPDANSPVIVTELMPDNRSAFANSKNRYEDYIELYNRSDAAVSLKGWGLSDDAASPHKWSFPDVHIEAGAYLLVYAVGRDGFKDGDLLCADFGLNAEGEQLVLSDPKGRLMDLVEFGFMKPNAAYSRAGDGSWTGSLAPTPDRKNQ